MDQTVPREINYLRMSITDRCQLRCIYCTSWQHFKKLPTREILSYEELLRLAGIAASLGIRKVRVTGGEPLVRRGVVDFIKDLRQFPASEKSTSPPTVCCFYVQSQVYSGGVVSG